MRGRVWGSVLSALWMGLALAASARAEVVVAEGEQFRPLDDRGWKVTHQNDSYASHTYGGMWVSQGGLLGAPADSADSVAAQTVQIPVAGKYRVWSKYQAPPLFNYLHKIEVVQKGRTVYSHVYGRAGTPRLWSFSGTSDELWWPWGIDHDSAEAPTEMVTLAPGPAEIRLSTVPNVAPAADRFVDFVVLTTNEADDYIGYKPYKVGTPFANEAIAASRLYMRFNNTTAAPARLTVRRNGHFQPNYGGATEKFPAEDVPAGKWSPWFNIGPFCRLVHDEGLLLTLADADEFQVQVARDPDGKQLIGDVQLASGEVISIPIDATWNPEAKVRASKDRAAEVVAMAKTWRTANGGKKPKEILYFGRFGTMEPWVAEMKHALGYNTQLPDQYKPVPRDGVFTHATSEAQIRSLAAGTVDKKRLAVVSFGDEISLGRINFKDPANQEKFRAWLAARKVTKDELGVPPGEAVLTIEGDPRLVWYSNLFNEEERFVSFRQRTELVKELIGPEVLTGANYSPHHLALCYGPVFQWVDIFKHQGMSMFWAEDYIFSVPEVPQMLSFMFAQVRCGVKYNGQPIHFYIMPHAPGQEAGFLRRNMLASVAYGARHIDSFWVAPEENFTENYVAWGYNDTFRVIHESIFDTAEAEKLLVGGKLRPARVAVITGKATDFNESRLLVDKSEDFFGAQCANAPPKLNQILCRKDQQMLYLALKHAQHGVDVITEDDIAERDELKNYDVVYFAGEWIDRRAIAKLDAWVQAGGVLYAAAGCGHLDQFGEPATAMNKLLGITGSKLTKNTAVIRTLLELPLLPPIGTITLDGEKIPAVGMRQVLQPAAETTVRGTWDDGSAAVTVHNYGKGQAFAVGTLAGNSYMKTALKVQPFARGGRHTVYNPVDYSPAATKLVRLGVDAKEVPQAAVSSDPHVEAIVVDHPQGTLLTLVNWTNAPVQGLTVRLKLDAKPKSARSVSGQKAVPVEFAAGEATVKVDLTEADYILLMK